MKTDPKTGKPNQNNTDKKLTPKTSEKFPKREIDPNNPVADKDKKNKNTDQNDPITNPDKSITNGDKSKSGFKQKAK